MKRVFLFLMAMALLSGAALAEGYNSFTDDPNNAPGHYQNFAWDGEYVYWLDSPDSLDWQETPNNIYRMRPGDAQAEIILQGREDLWVYSMRNIGKSLLLSAANENSGSLRPALVNFDGSGLRMLPGNIGSCVLADDAIYNSVDGGVYRIPLDTMKPGRIYSYPKEILSQNPILSQYADGKLYLYTDGDGPSNASYELNPDTGKLRMIVQTPAEGVAVNGGFYIRDVGENHGTWRYDLSTGEKLRISENTYSFKQGWGDLIMTTGYQGDEWFQGSIFDFSRLADGLEAAKAGECGESDDVILGGRLIHYDWKTNRVDYSDNPISELLARRQD